MALYTLTLMNKDPNLDLTQKRLDIKQVLQHIEKGGKAGNSFKDLRCCQSLQIHKDSIEVEVQESGNSWHRWVGRILANEHGMRKYCHGWNKRHMFKWNEVIQPPRGLVAMQV